MLKILLPRLCQAVHKMPYFFSGLRNSMPAAIRGQTTVEYLLAIGVIAVAMAVVLMKGGLFEALAELYTELAIKVSAPDP